MLKHKMFKKNWWKTSKEKLDERREKSKENLEKPGETFK